MFKGVGVGAEYLGYTISSLENDLDLLLSFPPPHGSLTTPEFHDVARELTASSDRSK